MPRDRRPIGLNVALARRGEPRYQVGAACGMPANIISGICTGRIQANARQRAALAAYLGVNEPELFDDHLAAQRGVS
jgi:hypothetical protein